MVHSSRRVQVNIGEIDQQGDQDRSDRDDVLYPQQCASYPDNMRRNLLALIFVVGMGACSYDFGQFEPLDSQTVGGGGGASGSAGAGGTSGSAGAGGTSGSAGAGGTSGSAGAGGTSGSGAGGTSGSSGSGGTAAPCTDVTINFQPAGEAVPAGTVADYGEPFGPRGQGCSFGWDADNTGSARVRGVDPDPRRDTLNHMQYGSERTWEVEVPNGTYEVSIVAGDASYNDSVYGIEAEGVLVVEGTPTETERFFTGSATIQVQDGRLSVQSAASAHNNKVCYLEIQPGS